MDIDLFSRFLGLYMFQPATAYWRAIEVDCILKHAHIPTFGLGLDLGCGDGKLTSVLFEKKKVVQGTWVGLDVDEGETQQALRTGTFAMVCRARGDGIPLADASVDFVMSNSVLEHIPDLDPVLSEVARILKPNGVFTFTVPASGFHNCLRGPVIPGAKRGEYLSLIDRRLSHFRYLTREQWAVLLRQHGLVIHRDELYLTRSEVQHWETIARFTGGVLYNLFSETRSPLVIQRQLGMRTAQNRFRMPRLLASALAHLLSTGVITLDTEADEEMMGGLMIVSSRAERKA